MLFKSQSDNALSNISKTSMTTLSDHIEKSKKDKPYSYDEVVSGLRVRYSGDQKNALKTSLQSTYKESWEQMPIEPVNWLLLFARQSSGALSPPPKINLDGIDVDDPRALAFAKALDQLSIDTVTAEVERVCNTGARAAVVVVGWRSVDTSDPGRAIAQIYWAHDVMAIAHPSAPDDERALYVVGLRQSDGVWWVWSREYEEDNDGRVTSWGLWQHCRMSEDGKISTPPRQYQGRLPVSFCRSEVAHGGFWPAPDRDVSAVVDGLNVSRSNGRHVVYQQGHGQVVISGTMDASEIPVGASKYLALPPGTTATVLNFGADHSAIAAARELDLREVGITTGQSPDAYSPTASVPTSGVSRQIANAPHDALIESRRPIFKRWLEESLLPIVVDVVNLFDASAPEIGHDVKPVATLSQAKTYEDPDALQRRVLERLDVGLISKARAGVRLGEYADEAAAVAVLGPGCDQIAGAAVVAPTPPTGESPFDVPEETTTEAVDNTDSLSPPVEDVAKTALNGAQVSSMVEIVTAVASGGLPREGGIAILSAAFQLPAVEAEKIMGEAGRSFKVDVPT